MIRFKSTVTQKFDLLCEPNEKRYYQFLIDKEGNVNISYVERCYDQELPAQMLLDVDVSSDAAIALRDFLNYCYPKS